MRYKVSGALAAVVVCQLLVLQGGQAFPDRPIKIVSPAPPGGPPDIVARLVSEKIAATLGKPVIVENKPGAGGTIAAKSVLVAEPDGHTLFTGSTGTILIAPLIYKNVDYNTETFAPISGLSESAEVLAVHPSVPARTVAELVKLAKSQPGMLRYGSAGVGSLPHLEGELLKARAGIDISHIPYRGGSPALTGLLGGEIHFFFSALTQMLPQIRDGKLRGLAVTSEHRSPLAPEIPTMVESGFEDFVTASINFIVAPPGTPIEVRQRISDAVRQALTSPDVKEAFARIGAEPNPSSPEALTTYVAQENVRWRRIVDATRISVDALPR